MADSLVIYQHILCLWLIIWLEITYYLFMSDYLARNYQILCLLLIGWLDVNVFSVYDLLVG